MYVHVLKYTLCRCYVFIAILHTIVVPNPPINVILVSVTARTANIRWQDGELPNPVNPGIMNYTVFLNGSQRNVTVNNAALLTDLLPFTNYTVTIIATNRIGNSDMSTPYMFTTMEEGKSYSQLSHSFIYGCSTILYLCYYVFICVIAPGAAPQNVVAQSPFIGGIELSWAPPPSEKHYGMITGYYITFQIDGGNPNTSMVTGLNTTLTGLQSNTLYVITIAAVNGAGRSMFNATISINTIPERE